MNRIRGTTLQNRRKRWFSANPLCVHCEKNNRISLARELDHIVPLFKGGQDDETNLQGLCKPCHDAKTAKDMGHGKPPKATIGVDGWPVEG